MKQGKLSYQGDADGSSIGTSCSLLVALAAAQHPQQQVYTRIPTERLRQSLHITMPL